MNGPSKLEKGFEKTVDKVWGREHWLTNIDLYCAKILVIFPGGRSSLHYHLVKDETFIVLEGGCWLRMGQTVFRMEENEKIRITPHTLHRFWVDPDSPVCKVLEVSTHHSDDDTVRLEPSQFLKGGNGA